MRQRLAEFTGQIESPDVVGEPGSWTAIGEASYVFCPPLTSVRDGGILSTGT
ncbi:hypothetical protein ACFORH_11350 [Amycolatopsis roodepoortensis]|uniref:Uncharacterized protein n=1 Tax=Amycolatopsis roodepoortensis TaxID=700274 RepID=A0ABR9LCE1_9PSEU|nr:hypothetical protein [Amycolatopsis roodepoortensis]MBE1577781.1 hypothetical protein [Amycolatopsis roodepoortensis]